VRAPHPRPGEEEEEERKKTITILLGLVVIDCVSIENISLTGFPA
jgi:hypothetical protein